MFVSSLLVSFLAASTAPLPVQDEAPSFRAKMSAEAEALFSFVQTELGGKFLAAVPDLPVIEPRTLHWNRATGVAFSATEAAALKKSDPAKLEGCVETAFDEQRYYETFYGTPVAYSRAIDLAAQHGLESVDGKRVFDFGYGGVGHLRLLASLGADAVGVDVQDVLRALYVEDSGPQPRAKVAGPGDPGELTVLHGFFPTDEKLVEAAGGGYSMFFSKNVLKKGYIHPEREADPSHLIHLGVEDAVFVRAVHDMLEPGGLMVIYNLYPKQAGPGERYIPWATGGCPFDRKLVEEIGFEVLVYDQDDTRAIHEMAYAIGWQETMAIESELFSMFTILRRPK